jgi:site-specific recombinase XerD
MFDMAVSEQVIPVNPTASLYTPKTAKRKEGQAMSAEQVEVALDALEDREKVILRLAVRGESQKTVPVENVCP